MTLTSTEATLQQVKADVLRVFGAQLGTYQTPAGPIPAYWAVDPEQVRPDWTCSGIECVLQDSFEPSPMGGHGQLITELLRVFQFTCFDPEQSLREVSRLAYRAWPKARQRRQRPTEETFERLTLEVPDHVILTPL